MPNHYVGDLLHTIEISGLPRVRTELLPLAVIAALAPHPVQMHRQFPRHRDLCDLSMNGQDALAVAQEFKPDVIVLDFSMPVMNGLEAGRILKGVAPRIPLILFTAFGPALNSEELRGAGFSALIGKDDAGKLAMTAQALVERP
jgi:CheY-like chemotaxis protein